MADADALAGEGNRQVKATHLIYPAAAFSPDRFRITRRETRLITVTHLCLSGRVGGQQRTRVGEAGGRSEAVSGLEGRRGQSHAFLRRSGLAGVGERDPKTGERLEERRSDLARSADAGGGGRYWPCWTSR